ncbi:MAG TPA: hypothetical protein VIC54_04415 [Terriglobales bacterium]|jgi:hypothetical protein
MNRTTEQLLTWAPLGAGLALILSGHRRIGLAVALTSPITAATQHPRGTRKLLRAVPRKTGKAWARMGKEVGHGMAEAGKSIRWLAS